MALLEALQNLIGDMLAEEGITDDVLEMVDLDIEHTPVIAFRGEPEERAVEAIKTEGGGYIVRHPLINHAVPATELKAMRARYLLAVKARQRREWAPLFERLAAQRRAK